MKLFTGILVFLEEAFGIFKMLTTKTMKLGKIKQKKYERQSSYLLNSIKDGQEHISIIVAHLVL